ncbi:hypothetical protein BMR07_04090 [Methylococcaceae bacterium CS1]|nr:hypothetical protein BMR11_15305 [Methylococcaceae bacterium CS5]TXL03492.1 hypothetical protein BMR09_14800 [Methylococcaceae bacterium CS3]TXL07751.1 hypothetical protein BMR07_04090 [Methylococcaceae bacterium CS1]TXL12212.1 hypothetical protein BMR08_00020 [Methylococcaceae bacterium CS2]
MSKKTRASSRATAHTASYNKATEESYQLTSAPILDQRFRNLPQDVQDEFNKLSKIAEVNGAEVIPRLLELKQQYPLPLIYSCLAIAYGRVDPEKQKQIITENYQKNPKNIFSRCNYAHLCLAENEPDEIPQIFENHFELKNLYPKRNQFHYTEYTGLTSVICEYYIQKKQTEQAKELFAKLQEISPDSGDTQYIKKLLEPGFFQRIWGKLFA